MKIRIDGLEVVAIMGVRAREREVPQPLLIDVEFPVPPPETDALDAAVDYSAVIRLVCEHVKAGRYHLIETVAETTAARVARTFGLDEVWIRVVKPGASDSARFVSAEHRLRMAPAGEEPERTERWAGRRPTAYTWSVGKHGGKSWYGISDVSRA